jgi:hypothetical protein
MAVVVFLISPEEFKEWTPLNGNVDEKLLRQSILACQDIFVQNIIGTGIYLQLKTQVQASTLTALNRTLLDDYLIPAMRYWIMGEAIRPMVYRMMNVGVQTKRTENTNTISDKEVSDLENHWRNRAEWYAQRCTDYLCENSTDYPLYDNPGTGADVIVPNRNNFTTSIFLGGIRGNRGTTLPTYDEPFRRGKKY